ncbi:acyl-CoA dehydrogenase [Pseudonocardia sp. GCM10023141]|uniref:acyl-CoA dehydrogenase n=1 Tax=Pseudonocardia sp. GCM10023141 TaxID=3252653 RepID=UPI00361C4CC1
MTTARGSGRCGSSASRSTPVADGWRRSWRRSPLSPDSSRCSPAPTRSIEVLMTYELSEEQQQLARMVGELGAARSQGRRSMDGGPPVDIELWKQLVELELVAMAMPERLGGAGGSTMDEVLLVEQLASVSAAVPMITTSCAADVLSRLVDSGSVEAADLASEAARMGRVVAAGISASAGLALDVSATRSDDRWVVSGSVPDLLEAAAAAVLLLPAVTSEGDAWFAVEIDPDRPCVRDQPSLDQMQRLGAVDLDDHPATLLGFVPQDGDLNAVVLAHARLLLAAQALGSAAKALDMTVAYAKQRSAFGQPIGRFQAVKHTLAEMLVQVENARSAVYDGAWAVDEGRADSVLAVHMAKALGTENSVHVIHSAIQLHGGIGFTWEHDLHLLLRRAKTAELVLGQPDEHFDAIGTALVSQGAERSRATSVAAGSIADREFQEELRSWLDENLPAGWGTPHFRLPPEPAERRAFLRDLQAIFATGGWVGIHWPKEFGGRSATLPQQLIFNSELVDRAVPQMPGHRGLTIVGPTLIKHGTDEQRVRFLERIRCGADLWAGGFSEPEAGSDLAGLRTQAMIDGDRVIVNGQKIWTSGAHFCDWIYTLVRTDPRRPRHEGISVVAIPLDTPGIRIQPIRQMNGVSGFNEVFFDDVEVPLDNIIGDVNAGWRVNRTTLSHEHFTLFIGSQARFARSLDDIIGLATSTRATNGAPRSDDLHVRNRLARAWTDSRLIRINGMRNVARVQAGAAPGPEGSIAKVFGQEAEKRLFELAIDVTGPAGVLDRGAVAAVGRGKWQFGYLGARAATIGGGTSEIHKNKISEGILGLPRDLGVDATEAR